MRESKLRVGGWRPLAGWFVRALSSALCAGLVLSTTLAQAESSSLASPAEHFGHVIGADRKLVGWEPLVAYMRQVAEASGRVNVREIGPTTQGRPFLLVEVSSQANMAELEELQALQRRLYFQGHSPGQDPESVHTVAEREELFEKGKAVVLITCSIHATEVGAAQMSLELVHHLATSDSPRVKKILDNTILLLVPSLNPDGQAMIVDWYDQHVETDFEATPMPWLYHPYVGHDNNRDMYMYTQAETRRIGQVLYQDWFPSIWLDEHQMGSTGARIFVMPATDPININVHPLIYRLNGVYGQAQAAALESAGKVGIVYDRSYTNFWEGAMAWTGWWHNQVGLLTELASVRVATPTEQKLASLGKPPKGPEPDRRAARRKRMERPKEPLPAPRDVQPRTNYPRPWLGGEWTLRDIVEYELIASLALLETAADTRGQLLRQVYEVNRTTIAQFLRGQEEKGVEKPDDELGYHDVPEGIEPERTGTGRVLQGFAGAGGTPYAVLVPLEQHDPLTAFEMLRLLERGGVIVERATSSFEVDGASHPAGTHVIRLAQVFGNYAKDMLEEQTYPDVRLAPSLPPSPPYDVTAWSLGMMMGVETTFVDEPFEAALEIVEGVATPAGKVVGRGSTYLVDAASNVGFELANRLLGTRARVSRARSSFQADTSGAVRSYPPGTWVLQGVARREVEGLAAELGLTVRAVGRAPSVKLTRIGKPRIAVYQPWTSNMDEGWTRWLLEEFGFDYATLHPQDLRAAGSGKTEPHRIDDETRAGWPAHVAQRAPPRVVATPLAERFDIVVFTHQRADDIEEGSDYAIIPPTYRGGIGKEGLDALRDFVDAGGTIVALGDATGLFVKHWPVPVRNVVGDLEQEEFLIPGSILDIQADPRHPLAWGMPRTSHGYFSRNPVFTSSDGFSSQTLSVPVRYPNQDLRASGWVRGEGYIAGRAAAVQVDFEGSGRIILLGLRPQHRAQTHATFKLLFNALMMPGP